MADRIPFEPLKDCARRWGVSEAEAAQALIGVLVTGSLFRVMGFTLDDLLALKYVCGALDVTARELAERHGYRGP